MRGARLSLSGNGQHGRPTDLTLWPMPSSPIPPASTPLVSSAEGEGAGADAHNTASPSLHSVAECGECEECKAWYRDQDAEWAAYRMEER